MGAVLLKVSDNRLCRTELFKGSGLFRLADHGPGSMGAGGHQPDQMLADLAIGTGNENTHGSPPESGIDYPYLSPPLRHFKSRCPA
jgi:hypothetical protein